MKSIFTSGKAIRDFLRQCQVTFSESTHDSPKTVPGKPTDLGIGEDVYIGRRGMFACQPTE